MSKTLKFHGQIVIPDKAEENAVNRLIGWTAKVELDNGDEADNPQTQEERLHLWIATALEIGIRDVKRVLAEPRIQCTSNITIESPEE